MVALHVDDFAFDAALLVKDLCLTPAKYVCLGFTFLIPLSPVVLLRVVDWPQILTAVVANEILKSPSSLHAVAAAPTACSRYTACEVNVVVVRMSALDNIRRLTYE